MASLCCLATVVGDETRVLFHELSLVLFCAQPALEVVLSN